MAWFTKRQADDDPVKELASWQLEHAADVHDMTDEQRQRYHQHAVMLNAGIDLATACFWRWLAEQKRVQP